MTIWYDCLNHKKIGTERATCTRTTAMGYNIANVYLSIEYCSIEYLHAMPCLWCMQLATKTFLYHITNMSPFIKKVRHVNLICNKETDERSRFPPISTRKGFLKKKKKKMQDVREEWCSMAQKVTNATSVISLSHREIPSWS